MCQSWFACSSTSVSCCTRPCACTGLPSPPASSAPHRQQRVQDGRRAALDAIAVLRAVHEAASQLCLLLRADGDVPGGSCCSCWRGGGTCWRCVLRPLRYWRPTVFRLFLHRIIPLCPALLLRAAHACSRAAHRRLAQQRRHCGGGRCCLMGWQAPLPPAAAAGVVAHNQARVLQQLAAAAACGVGAADRGWVRHRLAVNAWVPFPQRLLSVAARLPRISGKYELTHKASSMALQRRPTAKACAAAAAASCSSLSCLPGAACGARAAAWGKISNVPHTEPD